MQWIKENWAELTAIVLAVLRLAESIAEMTPSEKDDKVVAQVKAILKHFFSFGWSGDSK